VEGPVLFGKQNIRTELWLKFPLGTCNIAEYFTALVRKTEIQSRIDSEIFGFDR